MAGNIVGDMFTLDQVVPWGRSFDEYRGMFALTEHDLQRRILGCADGPASFNAEAQARGTRVVSCDPLYRWSSAEIRGRIDATAEQVLDQTRQNANEFVWDTIRSVEHLGRLRLASMERFLEDFERGPRESRYVAGQLPALPFRETSFDLALCSHFLFLYTDHLSEDLHVAAIRDMCRVAREVRIFPLLALGAQRSRHVTPTIDTLEASGCAVSIERVPYEFQRGGNEMMRVRRRTSMAA
jgi:hypothetical protein